MTTWKAWILGMLLLGAPCVGASETVTLKGKVQDSEGSSLGNLELLLSGQVDGETVQRTVKTDASGLFSAEVPKGVWRGVPDEIALLERGYFCVPGFLWDPDQEIPEGGFVEIPGQVLQVFIPDGITMTAIAVLPTLTVQHEKAAVTIKTAFKFPLADQAPAPFSGNYLIERSEDLESWELVDNLWLDSTTETTLVDSGADGEAPRCYYRSRREGPLIILNADFSLEFPPEG